MDGWTPAPRKKANQAKPNHSTHAKPNPNILALRMGTKIAKTMQIFRHMAARNCLHTHTHTHTHSSLSLSIYIYIYIAIHS